MPFFDKSSAVAAIEYLDEIVDDRKSALLPYLNKNRIPDQAMPDYYWAFREGNYDQVIERCTATLQKDPWNINAIVACSKACSALGNTYNGMTWLSCEIVPNLSSYFSGDEDAEHCVDSLLKTANNLRHADFSVPLIILLKSRTFRWFDRIEEQTNLTKIFSPDNSCFIEERRSDSERPSAIRTSEDFLTSEKMYENLRDGDLESALVFAKSLSRSTNVYFSTLGKSFHANLLAKTLSLEAALEESVSTLIDHPGLIDFTPLIDILKDRGFRHLKSIAASPALAAAFHIYSEHIENSDKEVSLKVAWKNFLATKNIDKPSLYKPTRGYSAVERFFLREVCTQETMEYGSAFSSQLDLDRERMAICANLSNEDVEHAELYNQEIIDLTRRINIEEGVELLESSRVFVDEIGIQKWAKKNLDSQFLRYLDYLSVGLNESIEELEAQISKILNSSNDYLTSLTSYLDDYDITADSLIEGVLRDLSQAFLQLPRFGLDSFLSSRIRHGSFVGYVRGPLESRRIVTKKLNETGVYYDNDFLLDQWKIDSDRDRKIINTRLAVLSESIDKILDGMVSNFLHVRSKSHPDGMVRYSAESKIGSLIKSWVVMLKTNIGSKTSLEAVISFSIEHFFWPAVRPSLDALKRYVQTNLYDQLEAQFRNFTTSVEGVTNKVQRERINEDVQIVAAELREVLRRVSLWFELPQINTHMLSMPLERVMEIGLISTRNARPSFDPKVDWTIEPAANIVVRGPSIGILNDLAFLVFANISKHAGYEDESTIFDRPKVGITMRRCNGSIKIRVSNSISLSKSLASIKQGIELTDTRIKKRDFDLVDKQKEGTGLLRLAIYFEGDDASCEKNLKYWLMEEERVFNVEFTLPASMVKMIGVTK